MSIMKPTQQTLIIRSLLSIVVFACYAYVVIGSKDMGKLFHYATVAYALMSLLLLLPAIWMREVLKWSVRIPLFASLFGVSVVIAIAMASLPLMNISSQWVQWAMLAVAWLIVVVSGFGYKVQ